MPAVVSDFETASLITVFATNAPPAVDIISAFKSLVLVAVISRFLAFIVTFLPFLPFICAVVLLSVSVCATITFITAPPPISP